MTEAQEELLKTLRLLGVELQEERERSRSLLTNTPIATRKKEGLTWYPVVINSEEIGLGDRLVIEVERNEQERAPGLFQQGGAVSLFSNLEENRKNQPVLTGVVIRASFSKLKIVLDEEDLPDWAYEGKLGLDKYFDERSYKEMAKAMNEIIGAEKGRASQLREILLGGRRPSIDKGIYVPILPGLNDSQNEAIRLVGQAEDVAVIHGPPGTGKTTALVDAIAYTLKEEKQVLVCAPSNLAVDLLATRLSEKGVSVLRMGHPARLSENVLSLSLDDKVQKHASQKELKALRRAVEEIRKEAKRYRRSFSKVEREERQYLFAQSKEMNKEARRLEDYIVNDLLDKSQAIVCTLVGSASEYLSGKKFKTVFIDEAAQALEPACWIPILKAERVVFAGDHCQLPPTIKSAKAQKDGLALTLFEKCITRTEAGVMLRTQYRMHKIIMEFSSRWFYDDGLIAAEEIADALLPFPDASDAAPLEFIDTAGTGFEEKQNTETRSLYNEGEADLLMRRLEQLLNALPDNAGPLTVGIISPYKDQVKYLQSLVEQADFFEAWKHRISVDTVDGFQGQERDMVFISLVRSNENQEIGFLADVRRMNVAITRARKKLVVIGDSATIGNHHFYSAFIDFAASHQAHRTAWEF